MFHILFSKEIQEHLKTFRFGAALITTFALVVASVWVLGDDFVKKQNEYNRLSESYAERTKEVRVPSEISPYLLRPISPLSIFAQGEDAHLGNAVQVSRWVVPSEAEDSLSVNRLLYSMPSFDLLSIFIYAISLFGVLLSYDAFCGEHERGTLKLLVSCSVKRGFFFTVKFLAGIIILAIPLLLSTLSALLILQTVHGISFSGLQWASVGMMILTVLLYGALFIAIGMLCSVLVTRSSVSLALALLFWTIGVVLVPSLGNGLAATIKPLKPREEISKFWQQTSTELNKKKDDFREKHGLNLSSYGSGNMGGHSPHWIDGQKEWLLDHMKYFRYYEPLYRDRADQHWNLVDNHLKRKKEQYWLGNALKSVSPAHHISRSLTALAGTDYETHAEFMEQCRQYRQAMLEDFRNKGFFDEKINLFFARYELSDMTPEKVAQRRKERERTQIWKKVKNWHGLFEPLPDSYFLPFSYQGGRPNFAGAVWPIASLAFLTVLFFAIGFVASVRFDVR